ncbi:hypothetical protein ABL78_1297 [Leptomonas seymouri]|uniref:C3H1-type domain-containing protein n=1 Tax=Leptomonas seymouri TaxID=5684 RepID=A0A0N1I2H1_LEPSE|nr:hypothetical protein ABL78_1297 [Leptomonas seymouri]|eukprot:KPI89632.1 hypothetical protein ABL78_1297 [Leptomonas seymouri]
MQDNASFTAMNPKGGAGFGQNYCTRDVITDPPTIIQIVPVPSDHLAAQRKLSQMTDGAFKISFDDVEPTAGWLSDRNNASLEICFMHSFGKCHGKAREKDSRTCHQIHVKREVLNELRKYYTKPQRSYFCRTMKANVTVKFAQVLSLLAQRRVILRYLEFRTEDVAVTAGSVEYEVEYRHWLVSDGDTQRKTSTSAAYLTTENFFSSSNLCYDFALTGMCPNGASCPDLHGNVAKALTKDRFLKVALTEMGRREPWMVTGGEASPTRVAVNFPTLPQLPSMPLLYPPLMTTMQLSPYLFAQLQPAPSLMPPVAGLQMCMSSLNGASCFVMRKDNDSEFSLVTQPHFTLLDCEGMQQVPN